MIPKKNEGSEPGQFRPITVSSVLARLFYKVFANRMGRLIPLNYKQKAFRPVDGCSENVFLMDFALRIRREQFKPLCMASLDVAKAFDSVSHTAIVDSPITSGVPALMVYYIRNLYRDSVTRLRCERWSSNRIHLTCEMKQGDPMSPMIFNLIIDRLFALLPGEVELRGSGVLLNAVAFADDLELFAESAVGF